MKIAKVIEKLIEGIPFPQTTPNELAYIDFKKWAYKYRGQYKKDIQKAGGNPSKIWKVATKWWSEWAKRTGNKAFSSITDSQKFGRALVVMMHSDNLIFDKNTHKITALKEGNFKLAHNKIEKWMPNDSRDQREFYKLVDKKDVKGLAKFIDMVADQQVLGKFIKGNEVEKLAKHIIMNEGKLNERLKKVNIHNYKTPAEQKKIYDSYKKTLEYGSKVTAGAGTQGLKLLAWNVKEHSPFFDTKQLETVLGYAIDSMKDWDRSMAKNQEDESFGESAVKMLRIFNKLCKGILSKGIVKKAGSLFKEGKVNKNMWKKMSDDEKENALLTVLKDPDDKRFEDYLFADWNKLPGWVQRDMQTEAARWKGGKLKWDGMQNEADKLSGQGMWKDTKMFPITSKINLKDLRNGAMIHFTGPSSGAKGETWKKQGNTMICLYGDGVKGKKLSVSDMQNKLKSYGRIQLNAGKIKESTAQWEKTIKALAHKDTLDKLSKSDKAKLLKIALLIKKQKS